MEHSYGELLMRDLLIENVNYPVATVTTKQIHKK